jgi:hypothetical protein
MANNRYQVLQWRSAHGLCPDIRREEHDAGPTDRQATRGNCHITCENAARDRNSPAVMNACSLHDFTGFSMSNRQSTGVIQAPYRLNRHVFMVFRGSELPAEGTVSPTPIEVNGNCFFARPLKDIFQQAFTADLNAQCTEIKSPQYTMHRDVHAWQRLVHVFLFFRLHGNLLSRNQVLR